MSVEPKVMEHVREALESFGDKYIDHDVLKRNAIIEDLDAYDDQLMTKLLSDDLIHRSYTKKIADVEIFEVNQFINMLEFKDYWEDSYTKYSNKIGLTVGGKFIDESSDVVLDFPFKDTVLKAGMSKEDLENKDDADEPFLNEVIAKPEIDELFEPKVLVNTKRYDESGVHEVTDFDDQDNIVIKGNNLVALYSLKKRYAGKIKLIYLDPPFNTGSDSFAYNDSFNHSSWLTFMQNRFEIAKELLSDDGMIFVHLDYNEDSYCKLLMDNVFGRNSYVTTISVKSSSLSGNKTQHKERTILKNKDSIIVFVKSKEKLKITPQFKEKSNWDTHYNQILLGSIDEGFTREKLVDYLKKNRILNIDRITEDSWKTNVEFRKFVTENSERVFRIVNSIPTDLKTLSLKNKNKIVYKKDANGNLMFALNGKRFSMLSKTVQLVKGRNVPAQLLGDLWTDIDFQNTQNQGGISFTNAKKPEQLLSRIISMSTDTGDIVLDFFMGSATTQAVALKMKRQFIGIEQMNYINTVSVPRLENVIKGEKHGISEEVNWQGGGSFVYAELMEKNGGYLRDIRSAETIDELSSVFNRMKETTDFDFRVDLDKFEEELSNFQSLDDRKKELIRILDKNQLYYNYANIDDQNVREMLSDEDYQFNKSFYEGGED